MSRPLRFRRLNRLRAFLGGYFWLRCPICREFFGGHEVGLAHVGNRAACKAHESTVSDLFGAGFRDGLTTPSDAFREDRP